MKTQTTSQKSSITQRLRTDLGRSVGVTTATQLVYGPNLIIERSFKVHRKNFDDACHKTHFKKMLSPQLAVFSQSEIGVLPNIFIDFYVTLTCTVCRLGCWSYDCVRSPPFSLMRFWIMTICRCHPPLIRLYVNPWFCRPIYGSNNLSLFETF